MAKLEPLFLSSRAASRGPAPPNPSDPTDDREVSSLVAASQPKEVLRPQGSKDCVDAEAIARGAKIFTQARFPPEGVLPGTVRGTRPRDGWGDCARV